jgi:hypothetical protein
MEGLPQRRLYEAKAAGIIPQRFRGEALVAAITLTFALLLNERGGNDDPLNPSLLRLPMVWPELQAELEIHEENPRLEEIARRIEEIEDREKTGRRKFFPSPRPSPWLWR